MEACQARKLQEADTWFVQSLLQALACIAPEILLLYILSAVLHHVAAVCQSRHVYSPISKRGVVQVFTDNDISTKYAWGRPHTLSSESLATISWQIPEGTPSGTYRLKHFGDFKHIFDGTTPFEGASSSFVVGSLPWTQWLSLQGARLLCSRLALSSQQ